jgi:NAD(P)H-dependent FMN reductase
MLKIAIIIGSTRPGRNGEAVAKWVYEVAQRRNDAEFELVDIKDFNLPLLDEPVPPIMGRYSQPHTKTWAAKIDSFDGYVFVTPEYNHGIPGALKNAVDFLFRRMEQQGRRLRQLRRCQWSARGRAAASGAGGGANGHRAPSGLTLHLQ